MAEPRPSAGGRGRRRYHPASIVGVYVLVLVVLQIFLLTVALDGFHAYDARLAWGAAVTSVVLTGSVVVIERLLGRR
jgi:hypothetical protein